MLPFTEKWMGHESIRLSEGMHRQIYTVLHLYMESYIKINQIISQLNWGQKECLKLVTMTRWGKYYVQSTFVIGSKLILLHAMTGEWLRRRVLRDELLGKEWQLYLRPETKDSGLLPQNTTIFLSSGSIYTKGGEREKSNTSWFTSVSRGVCGFLPPSAKVMGGHDLGCVLWMKQRCFSLKFIT